MKSLIIKLLVLGAIYMTLPCAFADSVCDWPQIHDAPMTCLLQEIRDLEKNLDLSYHELMSSLKEDQQDKLRAEQRAWLNARNAKCGIDEKKSNRSLQFATLAGEHNKSFCVIHEIRERIVQIKQMTAKELSIRSKQNPLAPPATALSDFLHIIPVSKKSGKWYFEVSLNRTGIAKSQEHLEASWPTNIWIGCATTEADYDIGTLVHIPANDKRVPETIGFAIDLDNGKMYIHQNGRWRDGPPNEATGKKIRQGQSYVCAIDSTVATRPLLDSKQLQLNLGESPFRYAPPGNFKAFHQGFLWIQAGETDDRRLYFDYRPLQQDAALGAAFVKEEFFSPRDSGDGLPNHTSRIAQVDIDCNSEEITERSLTLLANDGIAVAQIHRPRGADHRPGLDTVGGRFVKSVCFLRKHQINLPPPDIQERWEEMQSPMPSIKIMEAVERRQSKNGLLVIKQLNETAVPVEIFGKASRKLVAISALDCNDIASSPIARVRYGEMGTPIGIDFFDEKNSIRLEKNKLRFSNACVSFGQSSVR